MTILIADDDKLCRMLLRRVLSSMPGVEISEAEDGVAAWGLIERGFLPDLCIFDVMMPGLSGIDVLERIRMRPPTQHLRVALCTTLNDREHVICAAKLRVDAYIIKPYHAESILREVHKVAQEINSGNDAESAEAVCRRLGIEHAAYGELMIRLMDHMSILDGNVAAMISRGNYRAAAIQVNAANGACTNLGLRKIVHTLKHLETALIAASEMPDSTDEMSIAASRAALRDVVQAERKRVIPRLDQAGAGPSGPPRIQEATA